MPRRKANPRPRKTKGAARSSRTDEVVRAERDRAQMYLDLAAFIFVAIDPAGAVTMINRKGCEILGYEEKEILGKDWFAHFIPPRVADETRAVHRQVLASGIQPYGCHENPVLTRSGQERLILWRNALLTNDKGEVIGSLSSGDDITDLRRAEDERRRLEARVQQARKLESLGLMAGGIAHDFNNLLASILGNANLARMDLPETASGARESLEQVEKAARRAAELTGHLLAYSGKGRFLTTAVDLSDAAAEMTRLLTPSVGAGTGLVCHAAPDLPPVEADAAQVRQVIMNLITNASDAIGPGAGAISVSTGLVDADAAYLADVCGTDVPAPGRYVYVEVSDTGRGMDDETRARVFDPFFSTRATGRGLGLSVVLGIVRAHHGAIKIASARGGTTFRVLFPAASAEAKPAAEPGLRHGQPSAAGAVLVVDDDAAVRQMACMALERFGFSVVAAGSGREGIDLFRTRGSEIGAVLLDVTMPGMGGDEVFAEIRRMRSDVPIVLSSGYAETEAMARLADAGRVGFLQKPYLPTALVEKIREVLSA